MYFACYLAVLYIDAGHMIGLLGPQSVSSWGVAPHLEILGLGFSKMAATGFLGLVLLYAPRLLKAMSDGDVAGIAAENGFALPYNLQDLSDVVQRLKEKQTAAVIRATQGFVYKVTCGAGSSLICPPGYVVAEQPC